MKKSVTLAALFLFTLQLVNAADTNIWRPTNGDLVETYRELHATQKIEVSLEVMNGKNQVSLHTVTFDESGAYPINIRSGHQVPYVAKRTTSTASKEIVHWNAVFDGVSLEVNAAVTIDRKIMLDLHGEKSDVKKLRNYTFGNHSLQGPEVEIATFTQRLFLEDGQMIKIPFGSSELKVRVKRIVGDDDNE